MWKSKHQSKKVERIQWTTSSVYAGSAVSVVFKRMCTYFFHKKLGSVAGWQFLKFGSHFITNFFFCVTYTFICWKCRVDLVLLKWFPNYFFQISKKVNNIISTETNVRTVAITLQCQTFLSNVRKSKLQTRKVS